MSQKVSPKRLIIDTDIGVDDAAAIAWLFMQTDVPVEVLGITTVAGNTTVEHSTNNICLLLEMLDRREIPIIMGADKPLVGQANAISAVLHGPDGLWFAGSENPQDISTIPRDVPAFYRKIADEYDDVTLLALGPLTNLAHTIQRFPNALAQFSEVIVLGGSIKTAFPFDDFNFWEDPEAADLVFSSDITVTMITLEAEDQFRLSQSVLQQLTTSDNRITQFLGKILQQFAAVFTSWGDNRDINISDVTAAMYAIQPDLATEIKSGYVKVVTDHTLARGQAFIADNILDKIKISASWDDLNSWGYRLFNDPEFDLEDSVDEFILHIVDNALIVTDIDVETMKAWFVEVMMR